MSVIGAQLPFAAMATNDGFKVGDAMTAIIRLHNDVNGPAKDSTARTFNS